MMLSLRALVLASIAAVAFTGSSASQNTVLDLLTAGIPEIQSAIDAGGLTSRRWCSRTLARIEAFDRRGPQLRAVLSVNPRAAVVARGA